MLQEGNATKVERLFELVRTDAQPKWHRLALLNGMRTTSVRKIPAFPKALETASKDADAEIAKLSGDLVTRFDWPGKHPGGPKPLTVAEQQQFEKGKNVYTFVCSACHQPTGMGLDGLALPLVNSKWVLGDEQLLARILLKGKTGRFAAPMPALEMMADADLAAVLTYVRRNWGHEAPAVAPSVIADMRRAIIIRGQPYTDAELESIGNRVGE